MNKIEKDYIAAVFERFKEPEYFGIDSINDEKNPAYQRAWRLLHLKLRQYLGKQFSEQHMKETIKQWEDSN